jgi:tektin-1
MTHVVKPPTRFTHPEWVLSNKTKFRNAELERQAAERLANECDRLDDETRVRTTTTLGDVDKKLDQRVNDLKYWEDEIDQKQKQIADEIDKLIVYINRMEKAIESGTQEPLHLTQTCLLYRERRQGIDLVHDDVQKELLKEVEVHHGVQALLLKTLEQAKEQLRLNRKAKYQLDQDMLRKKQARGLDEFCKELKPNSEDIGYVEGVANIDLNSMTPEQWKDSVDANLKSAERQRQNSLNMRSIIDGILQQTSNDQTRQIEMTNRAFKRRIAETKDAKGKLEEHMARVLKEISNMEDNIQNVENAIADKAPPLKLAETRLQIRKGRTSAEQCRDSAEYRTIEEVTELKTDIGQLHRRLADCHASMKGLRRRQLDLEEDIQVKSNSIFIDEVQCMGVRDSIKVNSY